jgi:phosphoglycolate phosphatase
MPERRVVLFDLDGCILDSTEPILRCHNAALAEFGLPPVPADEVARHIGPPLRVAVAELLAERGEGSELVEPVVEAYRRRYLDLSIELAATYPGVPELIAQLAADERLAVCTSKAADYAVPILEHLGLAPHFELIVGPDLATSEPKVDTLARAIDGLADGAPLARGASVLVGDRHHDIDAARHHGLAGVGVTWGFGSRSELEAAGAAAVVDTPAQLAEVLAHLG